MPSSNRGARHPHGSHYAPRKGGRVLTSRRVHVNGTRRDEIDMHHLGRALLRLAQEHYDAGGAAAATPERAPVGAHEAHTRSNGPPREPPRRGGDPTAPRGRQEGASG